MHMLNKLMIELQDPTIDYITKQNIFSVLYDFKLKYTTSLLELKDLITTKTQNNEWNPNMLDYTNTKNVYPIVYSYIFHLKAIKEKYKYDVLYAESMFAFR